MKLFTELKFNIQVELSKLRFPIFGQIQTTKQVHKQYFLCVWKVIDPAPETRILKF